MESRLGTGEEASGTVTETQETVHDTTRPFGTATPTTARDTTTKTAKITPTSTRTHTHTPTPTAIPTPTPTAIPTPTPTATPAPTPTATTSPTPSQDPDDDGLKTSIEEDIGTDPNDNDTDGDGLSDGAEWNKYDTSPTVKDTDGDGLSDGREVMEFGTDPTLPDTDRDGLSDSREITIGTNPRLSDTDSDGLSDGAEVTHPELKAASPLRADVFVEIDWTTGNIPHPDMIQKVKHRFSVAPISNPDGTNGIDLHIFRSEALPTSNNMTPSDRDSLMNAHFQRENDGYFYAIAVESVKGGESFNGHSTGPNDNGQMAFSTAVDGDAEEINIVAARFMHVLGHSLGLSPGDYRGIDSTVVSVSAYESTMNYNAPRSMVSFSSGYPFDDWEHINKTGFAPCVSSPNNQC